MKLICVGRNYAEHAREMQSSVPSKPMLFMKPASAICRKAEIPYPSFTQDLHYELEVVLFINKTGKNISVSSAGQHFNRIGLGLDLTARDIQSNCKAAGHPWEKAKAFDNSAVISAPQEIPENIDNLVFRLEKNGEVVQEGWTKDLIFKFDYLVHYISRYFTLEEGDIIFTGTPSGVGPLKPGDQLKAFLADELLLNLSIIPE